MIKWMFKYGMVIFLFNTLLLSIGETSSFAKNIFMGLMVFYAIILIINTLQVKNVILHKAFIFLFSLNILNLFYFILFHSITDIEAIKYLLARAVQFSIISISIYYNYNYFSKIFLKHIVYISLGVIFLGIIIDPFIFSGRYSGLFWNPNMLSSFTCIAFASLFFSKQKFSRSDYASLFLMLLVILATGSRGALGAILLAFFFKYKFSVRNIIYALLASITYFLLINIQLDTSINRFADQSLFNDRLLQYKYAFETIMLSPIIGSGLDKYQYISPEVIPYFLQGQIGAHNGYLAILVEYGFIFGLLILGIIFYQTIRSYLIIEKKDPAQLFYFYIIFYALFASFYETMMTGINEFHTILFWFSLAFLSYSIYKKQHES